jgi:NMD protein affecting ribosome stability and mRNA decay
MEERILLKDIKMSGKEKLKRFCYDCGKPIDRSRGIKCSACFKGKEEMEEKRDGISKIQKS